MTVTGLRSNDGVVRCALYNSPAAFPKVGREWRGVITPIPDRQATCVFSGVPAGNYAVAFFHAEHNETQLTPGLFGKPVQGYGFPTMPPAALARRTLMLQLFATMAETWRCRVNYRF